MSLPDDRDDDGTPTRSLAFTLAMVATVTVICLYALAECDPTIPM